MTHDTSDDILQARRESWQYRGQQRPSFAVAPGPAQESVWDYPRPPAVVPDRRHVTICLGERVIADTRAAYRVLETAGAPTFYLPPDDVDRGALIPTGGGSLCEWKGRARYWDISNGEQTIARAAWAYPDAGGSFAVIAGCLAFYPRHLECFVDDARVRPQPGGFYGGWVTDDIVGPFKGEPGTQGW